MEVKKKLNTLDSNTMGGTSTEICELEVLVAQHEERLGKHERDITLIGRKTRQLCPVYIKCDGVWYSGKNSGNAAVASDKLSNVEARMRTEMKRKDKSIDEKLDGALRKVCFVMYAVLLVTV